MRATQIIATFMACLMVMLPIYSASVWAYYFGNIEVYGSDKADGFIKEKDTLTIKVKVKLDDNDLSQAGYLKTGPLGYEPFSMLPGCSAAGNGFYTCVHEETTTEARTSPWVVILCNNPLSCVGSEIVTSKEAKFTFDDKVPAIETFSLDKNVVGTGDIFVNSIKVVDNEGGSGIGTISFTVDDLKPQSYTLSDIEVNSAETTYENSEPIKFAEPANDYSDGKHALCAKATDRLKNEGAKKCVDFEIDLQAPSDCKPKLLNNEKEFDYLSTGYHNLKLALDIYEKNKEGDTGVGFDATPKVYADLSSIGGTSNVMADKCEKDSETAALWHCEWSAVNFNFQQETSLTLNLQATDKVGNKLNSCKLQKTIKVDNEGPVVEEIGVENDITEATGWVGYKGNTIYAMIVDAGDGISADDIKATCAELGLSSSKPSRWYPEDEPDMFYWESRSFTGANVDEVTIKVHGTDDIGNPFDEEVDVPTDFYAPEAVDTSADNSEVYVKIEETQNNGVVNYFENGDKLSFTVLANDRDSGAYKIIADLSKISNTEYYEEECLDPITEGEPYRCIIEDVLIKDTAYEGPLTFYITDRVNNSKIVTVNIKIYRNENAPPDNYIVNVVDEYIPVLNKAYLDPMGVAFPLTIPLIFKKDPGSSCPDDSIGIIDFQNPICECEGLDLPGQLERRDWWPGKTTGDYNGHFQIMLTASDLEFEKYACACEISMIEKCGDSIYANEELEEVKFDLKVDLSDTTPADELDAKIKKLLKDANGMVLTTGTWLDKTSAIGQKLCYVKSVVGSVGTAIAGAGIAFGAACDNPVMKIATLGGCDVASSGVDATQISWLVTTKGINAVADQVCALFSCTGPTYTFKGTAYSLGGGYCDDLSLAFSLGTDPLELSKKSYIFSLACGCIPGIAYNLNKWRQMGCWKAWCYSEITKLGYSPTECDKQYDFNKCVYISGQFGAFQDLIDFGDLFDKIQENPNAYLWNGVKTAVAIWCGIPYFAAGSLAFKSGKCLWYNGMIVAESVAYVDQYFDTKDKLKWQGSQIDYCAEMQDYGKEEGEEE